MDGWMDGWMDGSMDGWIDGWIDGWMDGSMDGWMDGWMDRWEYHGFGSIYGWLLHRQASQAFYLDSDATIRGVRTMHCDRSMAV